VHIPENVDQNCGIYRIKNMRNGKCYIGSSKNLSSRKSNHFRKLFLGKHSCPPLQNAWNAENDKSVFEFQIFIYCKEAERFEIEQKCIDIINPCYNVCKIVLAPPNLNGYKQTEEHRASLSESHIGQKAWNKGKNLSEEHRKNLSTAKLSKPPKQNAAAKLKESEVIEILKSTDPLPFLAKKYNVANETLSKILRNLTWKYITREKVWTVSELRKRTWTLEKRAEQSEANKNADMTADQRSNRSHKSWETRRKNLALLAEVQNSSNWPLEDLLPEADASQKG
jgi:group I intron endonuclease